MPHPPGPALGRLLSLLEGPWVFHTILGSWSLEEETCGSGPSRPAWSLQSSVSSRLGGKTQVTPGSSDQRRVPESGDHPVLQGRVWEQQALRWGGAHRGGVGNWTLDFQRRG